MKNSSSKIAVDVVARLVHPAAVTVTETAGMTAAMTVTTDGMTAGTDATVTTIGLGDNIGGAASAAPLLVSFKRCLLISQFFYLFTTVSSHFPGILILDKGQ